MKLVFAGFFSNNGTKYTKDSVPEEVKRRITKCIIDNDKQKQLIARKFKKL